MNGKNLMIAGAIGVIVGSLLPWASVTSPIFGTTALNGLQGDGIITLGLGIVLLVVGLVIKPKPGQHAGALAIIVGILIIMFAAYEAINLLGNTGVTDSGIIKSIGIGVPVILIGALVFTVGAGQKSPSVPPPANPPL